MNTLAARGIVPEPIARQPWEMLIPLVLLTAVRRAGALFGGGGAMQPFAHVALHPLRRVPGDGRDHRSPCRAKLVRVLTYPAYLAVLLMLLVVEIVGAGRRRQPALARISGSSASAVRTDEARHRAGAGALLRNAAGRHDRHLALAGAGGHADRAADRRWCCCSPISAPRWRLPLAASW